MKYACGDCNKKFRTQGALEMHDAAKHKHGRVLTAPPAIIPPVVAKPSFFRPMMAGFTGGIAAIALAAGAYTFVAHQDVPAITKALWTSRS